MRVCMGWEGASTYLFSQSNFRMERPRHLSLAFGTQPVQQNPENGLFVEMWLPTGCP